MVFEHDYENIASEVLLERNPSDITDLIILLG
jgi:hypothetical protein